MKFTDSKAAKLFWVFGRNEETNKKNKKSSKEYWNEGNHWSERAIIANTDWVTTLLVRNT